MKNKGISPLIGTVLLIGFTIGLALVIFTWGGDLIENLTKESGGQAIGQLNCINDVDLVLSNGCYTSTETKNSASFRVENKKDKSIQSYTIRLTDVNGNVKTEEVEMQLGPFGIQNRVTLEYDPYDGETGLGLNQINKAELLNPKMVVEDQLVACGDIAEKLEISNPCV